MMTPWLKKNWLSLLTHIAGLTPLALMITYYLTDALVNPTRYVILRSGTFGLIFLVASLACTPLRKLFSWSKIIKIRRPLGLYGFFYVALHLWAYLAWENEFFFDLIWRDLGERIAMPIGIAAFVLLTPLALTSTRSWQRRLGKGWVRLHRLVYLALPLSVWHYLWLDRDFITWPLIYTVIVALLLILRLPFIQLSRKKVRISDP